MDNCSTEFPTTLEGFKYKFNEDGRLVNTETGNSFNFEVSDSHAYNQKHYEALGEVITEHVYELLQRPNIGLQKLYIPLKAKEKKPKGFIFVSKDYETQERLLVLVHGSGVVKAGQWARRLIINDCLDHGTQIPYIKQAQEKGYGVVVLNTNQNQATVKGKKKLVDIKESKTPEKHYHYVWKNVIEKTGANKIFIVAHSYGGYLVVDYLVENPKVVDRVVAVAFTDSVHSLNYQSRGNSKIEEWFQQNSVNWVTSTEDLDTPMKHQRNSEHITRVSAGTTKHEETSWKAMESIFLYFSGQEMDRLKPGDEKFKKSNSRVRAASISSPTSDGLNQPHGRGNKRVKATHSGQQPRPNKGASNGRGHPEVTGASMDGGKPSVPDEATTSGTKGGQAKADETSSEEAGKDSCDRGHSEVTGTSMDGGKPSVPDEATSSGTTGEQAKADKTSSEEAGKDSCDRGHSEVTGTSMDGGKPAVADEATSSGTTGEQAKADETSSEEAAKDSCGRDISDGNIGDQSGDPGGATNEDNNKWGTRGSNDDYDEKSPNRTNGGPSNKASPSKTKNTTSEKCGSHSDQINDDSNDQSPQRTNEGKIGESKPGRISDEVSGGSSSGRTNDENIGGVSQNRTGGDKGDGTSKGGTNSDRDNGNDNENSQENTSDCSGTSDDNHGESGTTDDDKSERNSHPSEITDDHEDDSSSCPHHITDDKSESTSSPGGVINDNSDESTSSSGGTGDKGAIKISPENESAPTKNEEAEMKIPVDPEKEKSKL